LDRRFRRLSAPVLNPSAYWSGWDIARGLAGAGADSGVRSVVIGGVIQNVRYSRQQYALSCEAAALEMALSHEGIFAGQSQLLSSMTVDGRAGYYDGYGTLHWGDPYVNFVGNPNGSEVDLTGYGTYYSTVARVAKAMGGHVVDSGTGVSPQQLYADVLAGHPVVAWITSDWSHRGTSYWRAFDGRRVPWAGPAEHAVAVVGVSSSAVYVYNPVSGAQWVSRKTFEGAYSTYSDMVVVIS